MKKIKVGVVFGGMSTEHEISIVSGTSVSHNLDKNKYEIYPIYISKDGKWYDHVSITKNYEVGDDIKSKKRIVSIEDYLKEIDVVFPVLHGLYGEDGTLQGMLELLKIPYVGCKVLASSIAMDKVYTKMVFEKAKILQAKYVYIRKCGNEYVYIDKKLREKKCSLKEICKITEEKIDFPMFVKPSNSGSSVGINKAKNEKELIKYIEYASQFDNKILIEENIDGREIECSVLGNEDVEASCIGEIIPVGGFYSYDSKYSNLGTKLKIPADIDKQIANKVRRIAIEAFKAIDGKGFARVDFFVKGREIYINEINTIPGFTKISMYPKLWQASGLEYSELLDKLIELALENK